MSEIAMGVIGFLMMAAFVWGSVQAEKSDKERRDRKWKQYVQHHTLDLGGSTNE